MSAPGTLTKLFFDTVDTFGPKKPVAMRYKKDGTWRDISYQELEQRVRRFALALRKLGVQRGDRVAILSENRPEWAITDYACLGLGVTDVPIYPTLPANQIRTSSTTRARWPSRCRARRSWPRSSRSRPSARS